MPGTLSPPQRVSDPDMHHGTCVTHVPWCMSGSLTSGFLWNRWRGKRSRHCRRMCNPHFYGSGKRPIVPIASWYEARAKVTTNKSNISSDVFNKDSPKSTNFAVDSSFSFELYGCQITNPVRATEFTVPPIDRLEDVSSISYACIVGESWLRVLFNRPLNMQLVNGRNYITSLS